MDSTLQQISSEVTFTMDFDHLFGQNNDDSNNEIKFSKTVGNGAEIISSTNFVDNMVGSYFKQVNRC